MNTTWLMLFRTTTTLHSEKITKHMNVYILCFLMLKMFHIFKFLSEIINMKIIKCASSWIELFIYFVSTGRNIQDFMTEI